MLSGTINEGFLMAVAVLTLPVVGRRLEVLGRRI